MQPVELSIIVPVYNVEKYISRALQSCVDQNFKDIEIVVVDDCGQDKSMDIAYEFARKDHRIKIIHNPENLKLLKTRYEGAQAASADYIMFLDSDDYLDTSICEKIADVLKHNDHIDLLCFGMLTEVGGGRFVKAHGVSSQVDSLYMRREYCDLALHSHKCHWNLCGKVFKREIYLKALQELGNDVSVNMAEDALVYFHMMFHISHVYVLNQDGYFYCDNGGSLIKNGDIQNRKRGLEEGEKVISLITKKISTITEKTFCRFSKAMRRDLLFYHRHRKWLVRKLIHKNFCSRNFFKGIFAIELISYKLNKQIRKIL